MNTYSKNKKRRRFSAKSSDERSEQRSKNNYSNNGGGGNRRSSGKKRPVSKLKPSMLIKKAQVKDEVEPFVPTRTIDELPVQQTLISLLKKKGFENPSEIQDRTIDPLLAGKDILGIAQTGTGKTAAFLVPIIEQLLNQNQKPYALVVVPTRELALQVLEEFKSMTKGLNLYSECFIGGTNINKNLQALRRDSHLIIGTPGRLLDLYNRKVLNLRRFNTLVLDEFDRMLDMGFQKDVERIIKAMHGRKQTMLFSATLDKTQQHLIDNILHDPEVVKVSTGNTSGDNIDQDVIKVEQGQDKFEVLLNLLYGKEFKKVILFDETKHTVSKLCQKLNKAGIKSDQIQGNKSQSARQSALKAFKNGIIDVLVATDVAARGIDVSDVTHVINYQMPMTYDSYIHRIGRTGRAGQMGKALTFVS